MLIWLCKMRILRHYARMHTRTWGSKNRTFEHLRWITSFETWRYRGVRNVLRKRYRTSIEQQSDTSRTAIEYKPNDNRIPIEHDPDTNHTSERWYIELPKRSGDYERISRELWKNIQETGENHWEVGVWISENDIQTIWKSFSFIILKWWRSYDRKKKSLRFSSERSPRDFRLLYVMRQLIAAAVYSALALR